MSAGGGLLSQILGSLGGAPATAAIVVGGIVVGALGGGALAGGVFTGGAASSTGELAVYPCPDTGPALYTVPGGQTFLVTGKTDDGTWLRIHNPLPGRTEAWVETVLLTLKGSLVDIPVAECVPEFEAAAAAEAPMPSLTALQMNSPSPSPTPTPAPTANPGPRLRGLTASTDRISYDTASYCPNAEKDVTIRVRADDGSGVAGATLFWRKPGTDTYNQAPMNRYDGTAQDGRWRVTLNTARDRITSAGNLAFYVVATDTDGATRRLPAKGAETVAVAVCANTGPTIRASSTAGSDLSWKPLRTGACQYPTSTNIRARVDDVDGVDKVTLFFRPPGEGWRSKPMTLSSGRWTASLDTGSDKIIIADPPTDNLRWYVKATDKKGLESQSKTASIEIHRCDSEALFDGVFPTTSTYACTTAATISIATYANDPDQPNDGLRVVFHWSLVNPRAPSVPAVSGKMTANVARGNFYRGTTASFNGKTYYEGRLTVYAVTTDRYGGTTKSPTDTHSMSCQ